MKHAVYITLSELTGHLPTKEELTALLKSMSARTAAVVALRLNTIFRRCTGPDAADMFKFQSWVAANYLDEKTRAQLIQKFGDVSPKARPLFHPLQLLYFSKLAITLGRDDAAAREENLDGYTSEFGKACLMINDLFCTPEERVGFQIGSQDEKSRELMVQLLAGNELSNPTPIRQLFIRSFVTYSICLKDPVLIERIKKECRGLDFERSFGSLFQTTVMGWVSMVAGLYFHLRDHSLEDFISKPEVYIVNRKTCLANSFFDQSQIDSFFDSLSMTFDGFEQTMNSAIRPVDERLDLLPFKAKPFLQIASDVYTCFDPALLAEQLHTGPYFAIWERLPTKQDRDAASSAWGLIFESYVQWLFSGIKQQLRGSLYFDTIWDGTEEKSFDAVLVRARVVVVFEFKSGLLTQEARYSNDSTKFMDDLKNKIGKGCRQLARDTSALLPLGGPARKLNGVALPSKVEFVIPVLIVQDPMLRTPFINYFLNNDFQEARIPFPVKRGVEVLPLNVVHITALEGLIEMVEQQDLDLVEIFFKRSRADASMKLHLNDFLSQLPEMKVLRKSERFTALIRDSEAELTRLLTGKEPVGPTNQETLAP